MAHKHKNANPNPIRQISPSQYFSQERENMPAWLANHKKGDKVDFTALLASKIIYYPGSALDGSPIRVFNQAHAAHVYFYIDYGFTKEEIEGMMAESVPKGYHVYDDPKVTMEDLVPRTWRCHLTTDEKIRVQEGYNEANVPIQNSFGLLKIYERDESYGEDHGAKRFAVLFLGGDAIATYDAIFGNTNARPFAFILGTYGFGGAYESFCVGSLLETIANRINRLPKYIFCDKQLPWSNYSMLKTVGGTSYRFVFAKDSYMKTDNDLDKNLKDITYSTKKS